MNLTAEINELKNIAQHIAAKLENFILEGDVAPGTRLIQTKVAEQFGVSRLPVRDAFAILIKKELAVPLPRKGVMVRPVEVRDVHNLFEVRRMIETAAIRKSAPLLTGDDIAQARRLVGEQASIDPRSAFTRLLETDERFHRLLWSRQDNAEIDLILERIWSRIKLIRAQARDLPEWRTVSVSHHIQIVDAITDRNLSLVERLVADGIDRSERELTKVIDKNTKAREGRVSA